MKRTLLLSIGILGCLVQSASADVSLFTTWNDFGQFNGGAGNATSLYYWDSSTLNGVGNTVAPGGPGGAIGSLQLTATGGWNQWISGSTSPGQAANQGFLSAIDPGAIAAWSAGSGGGPGTLVAYSGSMSFDLYRGNFTDWSWFGITLNYNGTWNSYWASTSSDFTGADGRTWTHFEVPYTINAVSGGLNYFEFAIAQNAGGIADQTFYIDNFQATVVPEPATAALLGLGLIGFLVLRRPKP